MLWVARFNGGCVGRSRCLNTDSSRLHCCSGILGRRNQWTLDGLRPFGNSGWNLCGICSCVVSPNGRWQLWLEHVVQKVSTFDLDEATLRGQLGSSRKVPRTERDKRDNPASPDNPDDFSTGLPTDKADLHADLRINPEHQYSRLASGPPRLDSTRMSTTNTMSTEINGIYMRSAPNNTYIDENLLPSSRATTSQIRQLGLLQHSRTGHLTYRSTCQYKFTTKQRYWKKSNGKRYQYTMNHSLNEFDKKTSTYETERRKIQNCKS
eukprot:6476089-Amphidinium_carterae.1